MGLVIGGTDQPRRTFTVSRGAVGGARKVCLAAARVGGSPLASELNRPHGVTLHPDGSLIIVDSSNHRLLQLVPRGEHERVTDEGSAAKVNSSGRRESPLSAGSDGRRPAERRAPYRRARGDCRCQEPRRNA